jgi:hypothetical protein
MTETREAEPQSTQPDTRVTSVVFADFSVCISATALWAFITR